MAELPDEMSVVLFDRTIQGEDEARFSNDIDIYPFEVENHKGEKEKVAFIELTKK